MITAADCTATPRTRRSARAPCRSRVCTLRKTTCPAVARAPQCHHSPSHTNPDRRCLSRCSSDNATSLACLHRRRQLAFAQHATAAVPPPRQVRSEPEAVGAAAALVSGAPSSASCAGGATGRAKFCHVPRPRCPQLMAGGSLVAPPPAADASPAGLPPLLVPRGSGTAGEGGRDPTREGARDGARDGGCDGGFDGGFDGASSSGCCMASSSALFSPFSSSQLRCRASAAFAAISAAESPREEPLDPPVLPPPPVTAEAVVRRSAACSARRRASANDGLWRVGSAERPPTSGIPCSSSTCPLALSVSYCFVSFSIRS
eukprot:1309171-Prymnesium_polylepis.2